MKYVFLYLCFSSFMLFSQNEKDSFWLHDLDQALEVADKENKTIVMYFTGSDWCRPCMMLQEDFFGNSMFDKYKKSFVFLYIDIPRNRDLLTQKQKIENYKVLNLYNTEKAFPLICMLNTKGKVLDEVSGYSALRDPKDYFELLEKFSK